MYVLNLPPCTEPLLIPQQAQGNMHRLQRMVARKLSAIGSESNSNSASTADQSSDSVVSSPLNPSWNSNESYSYSEEDDATFGLIFLLIVVMIFAFFLAYLKVRYYSTLTILFYPLSTLVNQFLSIIIFPTTILILSRFTL